MKILSGLNIPGRPELVHVWDASPPDAPHMPAIYLVGYQSPNAYEPSQTVYTYTSVEVPEGPLAGLADVALLGIVKDRLATLCCDAGHDTARGKTLEYVAVCVQAALEGLYLAVEQGEEA